MNNWTYFATYNTSSSEIRALPQAFSELFITNSTESDGAFLAVNIHFLIPKIIIPNASSVDQALNLVDHQMGKFHVLRIWSGNMMLLETVSPSFKYDIYYR